MAYALKAHVGKFIITTITEPVVPTEAKGYIQLLGGILVRIQGQAVMFTDVSQPQHTDRAVMEAYGDVLKSNNGKLLRSALYVKANSPVGMSVYNMVKANNHPSRRMFTHVEELQTWLAEALNDTEKAALDSYVAQLK